MREYMMHRFGKLAPICGKWRGAGKLVLFSRSVKNAFSSGGVHEARVGIALRTLGPGVEGSLPVECKGLYYILPIVLKSEGK